MELMYVLPLHATIHSTSFTFVLCGLGLGLGYSVISLVEVYIHTTLPGLALELGGVIFDEFEFLFFFYYRSQLLRICNDFVTYNGPQVSCSRGSTG